MKNTQEIVLAGGCFWGLQELMRKQKGVVATVVGYAGGKNENPTYENHPGHAEALKITFDPKVTNLENILDYFFRIHNPTTLNQQGNDLGDSYRSTIFYTTEAEKELAKKVIKKVDESKFYSAKVVTTLEPLTTFWRAEEYHQDYLQKHPGGYTCHYERNSESLLE